MACLRFKGFDEEFLRQQRPLIISEFSRVSKVPQDAVRIELLRVLQITDSPRSLEISMFARDQSRHDAIAENLYDLLSHFGYRDVHIFFIPLLPSLYYQEGLSMSGTYKLS